MSTVFYTCEGSKAEILCVYALEVALEREVEGDLFLPDIGQGLGFRPGSFDGAIRSFFRIRIA